ncbi:hypothetical protein [Leadbetterella sp. DM7]|uniref:hypothetical protein n=1 Tax=Leadbetterella sp. DM7 TaxID=3235085 RepID=UPI00349E8174
MNLIHGLSDIILAVAGIYVFFRYINPLELSSTILWESFILSVVVAAGFGALGFFGFEKAIPVSRFFQTLATINGAIGLVAATAALVSGSDFSRGTGYAIIAAGFVFFTLYEVFDIRPVFFWVPIICMTVVLFLGLFALIKGNFRVGLWVIAGVTFFALGSFREDLFGTHEFSISLYHLLMAAGVLSIGMANSGAVPARK